MEPNNELTKKSLVETMTDLLPSFHLNSFISNSFIKPESRRFSFSQQVSSMTLLHLTYLNFPYSPNPKVSILLQLSSYSSDFTATRHTFIPKQDVLITMSSPSGGNSFEFL